MVQSLLMTSRCCKAGG